MTYGNFLGKGHEGGKKLNKSVLFSKKNQMNVPRGVPFGSWFFIGTLNQKNILALLKPFIKVKSHKNYFPLKIKAICDGIEV